MTTMIFVNLPVKDLKASIAFYKALGYTLNPQYTDDTAACMVVCESIYIMLLTHPKFAQFTPRAICDATAHTEVLNALAVESREAVDRMLEAALASGAVEVRPPEEYDFMYSRSFADLDGHIWEPVWMNPAYVE